MSRKFILINPEVRQRCLDAVTDAPEGYMVKIAAPGKSRDQECLYHAQLNDIAKQWEFCGRLWELEDMKRLCIDQFRRDTKDDPELKDAWASMGVIDMAPSIDKTGVVALGVQSRKFPKVLASAFVEFLYALGAEVGVKFNDPKEYKP